MLEMGPPERLDDVKSVAMRAAATGRIGPIDAHPQPLRGCRVWPPSSAMCERLERELGNRKGLNQHARHGWDPIGETGDAFPLSHDACPSSGLPRTR
jgi:hypothetical protein